MYCPDTSSWHPVEVRCYSSIYSGRPGTTCVETSTSTTAARDTHHGHYGPLVITLRARNYWMDWVKPIIATPKWWRWYDVFRIKYEPRGMPLGLFPCTRHLRKQEPVSRVQRARRKRRNFVQYLGRKA